MKKNSIKTVLICIVFLLFTACAKNNKILEYRREGINAIRNNNYSDALNYFNIAIKTGNGQVGELQYDLLMYKAECLFMLGKYEECRNVYSILVDINPNNKQFKELYGLLNDISKLTELKNALNNDDTELSAELINQIKNSGIEHDKSVLFNQAVLYEKQGNWRDALNTFNYYIKLYPNDQLALQEINFITVQLK